MPPDVYIIMRRLVTFHLHGITGITRPLDLKDKIKAGPDIFCRVIGDDNDGIIRHAVYISQSEIPS